MLFSEPEIRKTTICDIFGHHHPNNREPTLVQWNCPCMVLLLSIYVYVVGFVFCQVFTYTIIIGAV